MHGTYAVLEQEAKTIAFRERDVEPGAGEALVKIHACGICHGDINDFKQGRQTAAAFGHEPVGEVVALGHGVSSGVQVGDLVVGNMDIGFADYAVGKTNGLFPIPQALGEYGALVEPIKCVTTSVRAIAADYGDTVVVVGCGFMGLAAIAMLAGSPLTHLVAVETDPKRQVLAREFGATEVIDPSREDAVAKVNTLTAGQGADAAVDFAGSQQATTMAAHMLRTRGRLAAAAGFLPLDHGWDIYIKALTIMNTPPMFSPDPVGDWQRTISAMAAGRYPLQRLLTHRHALRDMQMAFETASGGASVGYLKGIIVND